MVFPNMLKPVNTFIIGAPKCGTTSLAMMMAGHPDIYMSSVKEPNYFGTDFPHRHITNVKDYESLFRMASRERVLAEASVWYLLSKAAAANILSYNPLAKFIVMLRNPVQMALSLHEQQVFNGNETETDFLKAWNLQRAREAGMSIPPTSLVPQHLQYGNACRLGEQVQRLLQTAEPSRVLMLTLDDLVTQFEAARSSLALFLEVPPDGFPVFPKANTPKERPLHFVHYLFRRLAAAKRRRGIRLNLGVSDLEKRMNVRYRPRPEPDASVKALLTSYFRDDIHLLGELLKRDLQAWLV